MSTTARAFLIWAPRVAGTAVVLFISLFALDAFEDRTFVAGLGAFAIHLLPSAALAGVIAVAWRFPWVGAVLFGSLAAVYATNVPRHPDWVLVISGPLFLTAALYAASALASRPRRSKRR